MKSNSITSVSFVTLAIAIVSAINFLSVTPEERAAALAAERERSPLWVRSAEPTSPPIEIGQSMKVTVAHCGMLKHGVDFDGSYWEVDPATMSADERGAFGINFHDRGTITLISEDVALFETTIFIPVRKRKPDGTESILLELIPAQATLYRHHGPRYGQPCM